MDSGDAPLGNAAPERGASARALAWAATMHGHAAAPGFRTARPGGAARVGPLGPRGREEREREEDELLAPGATRASGAGCRERPEEPDPRRTCFERDRDRILHSTAFRRLAGKTQVFVFPDDHQRTRLTHALEVAQVATAIARALRLNVALAEAIALGHDCGHGPGGHASEDAFSPFLAGGYDHAVWGADVVLAPLNLTAEVLDGVRNHSWSRPAPSTPEGEVVSWADRIAYSAHDLEDAAAARIVSPSELPPEVATVCGTVRAGQLRYFVTDLVDTTAAAGIVAMSERGAAALAALREFNYARVYTRPEAAEQALAVRRVLGALVEHFVREHPAQELADARGGDAAARRAVAYVAGMTDRYACDAAVSVLGWPEDDLPRGFDLRSGARALGGAPA
ncbi:MAG TPA: HD domain-containing protein [Acidimicrobiales bacterium]|nr:HD domain-containing protein [Acidimicrobiales bacterium]